MYRCSWGYMSQIPMPGGQASTCSSQVKKKKNNRLTWVYWKKVQDNGLGGAMSWKTPREVRARTCGTKSSCRSEALRFIDSFKSPSTKIDGSLVNFRRRLSNRHGRPRRMLIWPFEGNTDQTVSTSTWFAQVGSSVLIELGQIAGSAKCMRVGGLAWVRQ